MPSQPADGYRELLLGCGRRRDKMMSIDGSREWRNLTTLDINPNVGADIEWDLERLPYPFADNCFDELHAYEVLEHLGRQGDFRAFFAQFSELWRILKPQGILYASCPGPGSKWLWGDPGHTRAISPEALSFLHQPQYDLEYSQDAASPRPDYRWVYRADFDSLVQTIDQKSQTFLFALQAVKPSRITI